MKYIATKKFFTSVSDKFDKNYAVSEDLRKVANGDYLTNFLLTVRLRNKVQTLLKHIDEWKGNNTSPEEFRDRLKKI